MVLQEIDSRIRSKMEEIEREISSLRQDLELYQSKVRRILMNMQQEGE